MTADVGTPLSQLPPDFDKDEENPKDGEDQQLKRGAESSFCLGEENENESDPIYNNNEEFLTNESTDLSTKSAPETKADTQEAVEEVQTQSTETTEAKVNAQDGTAQIQLAERSEAIAQESQVELLESHESDDKGKRSEVKSDTRESDDAARIQLAERSETKADAKESDDRAQILLAERLERKSKRRFPKNTPRQRRRKEDMEDRSQKTPGRSSEDNDEVAVHGRHESERMLSRRSKSNQDMPSRRVDKTGTIKRSKSDDILPRSSNSRSSNGRSSHSRSSHSRSSHSRSSHSRSSSTRRRSKEREEAAEVNIDVVVDGGKTTPSQEYAPDALPSGSASCSDLHAASDRSLSRRRVVRNRRNHSSCSDFSESSNRSTRRRSREREEAEEVDIDVADEEGKSPREYLPDIVRIASASCSDLHASDRSLSRRAVRHRQNHTSSGDFSERSSRSTRRRSKEREEAEEVDIDVVDGGMKKSSREYLPDIVRIASASCSDLQASDRSLSRRAVRNQRSHSSSRDFSERSNRSTRRKSKEREEAEEVDVNVVEGQKKKSSRECARDILRSESASCSDLHTSDRSLSRKAVRDRRNHSSSSDFAESSNKSTHRSTRRKLKEREETEEIDHILRRESASCSDLHASDRSLSRRALRNRRNHSSRSNFAESSKSNDSVTRSSRNRSTRTRSTEKQRSQDSRPLAKYLGEIEEAKEMEKKSLCENDPDDSESGMSCSDFSESMRSFASARSSSDRSLNSLSVSDRSSNSRSLSRRSKIRNQRNKLNAKTHISYLRNESETSDSGSEDESVAVQKNNHSAQDDQDSLLHHSALQFCPGEDDNVTVMSVDVENANITDANAPSNEERAKREKKTKENKTKSNSLAGQFAQEESKLEGNVTDEDDKSVLSKISSEMMRARAKVESLVTNFKSSAKANKDSSGKDGMDISERSVRKTRKAQASSFKLPVRSKTAAPRAA